MRDNERALPEFIGATASEIHDDLKPLLAKVAWRFRFAVRQPLLAVPPDRATTEPRAVLRPEARIVAFAFAGLAQMLLQVAHSDRHADGLRRERLPVGPSHMRAERYAPCRERNIGSDDDVVALWRFGDPVIGRVCAFGHHHMADHRIARGTQPAIRDESHDEAMALSDFRHLGFDRAGVGIDVNLRCSVHDLA